MTPQLEIHDWDDDFVRLATAAKLGVFSGSNALVASPLLLKAQDPVREKPTWSSNWDPQRQSVTDCDPRYEPTWLPESALGEWQYALDESMTCGTILNDYLDRRGGMEPEITTLGPEEVPFGQHHFRPMHGVILPRGARAAPFELDELDFHQRLAYRDLLLLHNEGHVSIQNHLSAEDLGATPFLPGAFVEEETARFAQQIRDHHPHPDDYVSHRVNRWLQIDRQYRTRSKPHSETVLEGVCALAGARLAMSALPSLELRSAEELLELRQRVTESLAAFQQRVEMLARRAVEIGQDEEPNVEGALKLVLWQLRSDYDDLKKAINSVRVRALLKEGVPAFSSVTAGLAVTLSAGVATGGAPLALVASVTAVPVAQVVKVGVEWFMKSRSLNSSPLYWRYQLEHAAPALAGRTAFH